MVIDLKVLRYILIGYFFIFIKLLSLGVVIVDVLILELFVLFWELVVEFYLDYMGFKVG